jgi:hypothetical protein
MRPNFLLSGIPSPLLLSTMTTSLSDQKALGIVLLYSLLSSHTAWTYPRRPP